MASGIVYIVRNPAFSHLVKIGHTTKSCVEDRGLNASNVPEDFKVLFAYECENYREVESAMHEQFNEFRHYAETGRSTEFFYIGCLDKAKTILGLLEKAAKNVKEELQDMIDDKQSEESEYDAEKVAVITTKYAPRTTFSMLDIPIGSDILFIYKDSAGQDIICKVVDDRQVEYSGGKYTLTALASKLLPETGHPQGDNTGVNGWWCFKYDGEVLGRRRIRIESEITQCETDVS